MVERIAIPETFPEPADIAGKRIVLTGAGRGLGEAIAHGLSRAGARLALVARTAADLEEVAARLPGQTLRLAGDVSSAEFNDSVADAVVEAWGGLDVWIANAGISPILAGPVETEPDVWRRIVDVNLTGAFLGARAAARVMLGAGQGGRIIFTGSVLGERAARGLAAYSASKAGVVGLAKALALDLAKGKITVNVVAPGWFDSPLVEGWKANEKLERQILDHTALERWGQPSDLVGAFRFLASDAAAFITGNVLNVDGGYLLK